MEVLIFLFLLLLGMLFSYISFYLDDLYGEDFEIALFKKNIHYHLFWIILSLGSWMMVLINYNIFLITWKEFFKNIKIKLIKIIKIIKD